MINRAVLFLFSFLAVFGVFGCSSGSAVLPLAPGEDVCFTTDSLAAAMAVCEDVLVRMHFEIEKFDVDKGYIKTRPLRGGQFFEFWRSDNVGAENSKLSNLHSVLRTAELQVAESDDQFCVECTVHMRRLSIEETEITSYSINRGIFSGSRTFQKLRPDTEYLEWIDMGSDSKLARRILGRILFKSASAQAPRLNAKDTD